MTRRAQRQGRNASRPAGKAVRVLHVLGTLDHGGAELRALEQMGALSGRGVIADFLCLSGRPGSLAERPNAWGGEVIPMRLSGNFAVDFLGLLRSKRYEVVHSHVATASGLPLTLARLAGVPHRVAQFHSDGDGRPPGGRRRLQQEVLRWLIRVNATALVGVSPQSLAFGAGSRAHRDGRASILTNGVAESREPVGPRVEGPLRLVNVGRPLATKRREVLVPILDRVKELGVEAQLVVVGKEGDDTQRMQREAREVGCADAISFLGIRNDVRRILNESDVLVFPSSREGLPVVLLEALFEGTPVVASDLPGMRFIRESVPGVPLVTLPVEAPPETWAREVAKIARSAPDRQVTRDLMVNSPFTMQHALEVLEHAYGMSQRSA